MNWDSEANVPQLCQGGERERRRNEKTKKEPGLYMVLISPFWTPHFNSQWTSQQLKIDRNFLKWRVLKVHRRSMFWTQHGRAPQQVFLKAVSLEQVKNTVVSSSSSSLQDAFLLWGACCTMTDMSLNVECSFKSATSSLSTFLNCARDTPL